MSYLLVYQFYLSDSQLEAIVDATPELKHSLYQVGKCAVCKGPFINSWLDCVHFVEAKKVIVLYQHIYNRHFSLAVPIEDPVWDNTTESSVMFI